MKKVLIISFSNLEIDQRVIRHINALKENYKVTVIGYNKCNISDILFLKIKKPKWDKFSIFKQRFLLLLKAYEIVYKKLPQVQEGYKILYNMNFDLVLANDIESLPLVINLFPKTKILYDAHEYAPRQFEHDLWWNFYFKPFKHYLCKQYLPKVNQMITVCEGLSHEYEKNYGVKCKILTNASEYKQIEPTQLNDQNIKIIYHGYASPNRKIELMIKMMEYVDNRFHLDLMVMKSNSLYYETLKILASKTKNVNIVNTVNPNEIIQYTNEYDIGIFLLEPTTFNLKFALPNKLFEYIQARLMVAIGPSVEMRKYVEQYNLGIVSKDFTPKSIAEELNKLTKQDILKFKENSNKAALTLNSKNNISLLKDIVKKMLS